MLMTLVSKVASSASHSFGNFDLTLPIFFGPLQLDRTEKTMEWELGLPLSHNPICLQHTKHVLCVFYDGNLSARQTLQIHLTLVSNPLFYFLCWILNFYLNPVKKKARNNTKHIWHIFVGFSSNITSPGSCLPDGVSESVMFSAMASKSQQVSALHCKVYKANWCWQVCIQACMQMGLVKGQIQLWGKCRKKKRGKEAKLELTLYRHCSDHCGAQSGIHASAWKIAKPDFHFSIFHQH